MKKCFFNGRESECDESTGSINCIFLRNGGTWKTCDDGGLLEREKEMPGISMPDALKECLDNLFDTIKQNKRDIEAHRNQVANLRDEIKRTNDNLQRTRTRLDAVHERLNKNGNESLRGDLEGVNESRIRVENAINDRLCKLEHNWGLWGNSNAETSSAIIKRLDKLEQAEKCSCNDASIDLLEMKHGDFDRSFQEQLNKINAVWRDWEMDNGASPDLPTIAMRNIGNILKGNK